MSSDRTIISDAQNFDASRMIFSTAETKAITPNDPKGPSYKRINIKTTNDDGSIGDLVLEIPNAFTFGVQENKDQNTQEVNGYVLPIVLWSRPEKGGPTEAEKAWVETFNRICDRCVEHLLLDETKDEIGKYDLERAELKKFNPLWWKKDKGKVVEGTGPMLYGKLMVSKKKKDELGRDTIMTVMMDSNTGADLTVDDVTGKYFSVKPACVKIESIYIGARISLQVKISEFIAVFQNSGSRRLLSRPIPTGEAGPSSSSAVSVTPARPPPRALSDMAETSAAKKPRLEEDDDAGSINDDDDDDDVPAPPPKPVAAPTTAARNKPVPTRKK